MLLHLTFRKNKTAKGAADIYYYKLGFKPVPKIKPKSFDIKKLWETEKLTDELKLIFKKNVLLRLMILKNV